MNVYEIYPRSWLRPGDLEPGKAYRRRVAAVSLRESPPGPPRLILSLDPPISRFSEIYLNRSSAWAIAAEFGPDTDDWGGKEVLIYRKKFRGREGVMVVPAPPPRNQQRKED